MTGAEDMVRIADKLNQLDDQLYSAERDDNLSEQVAVLRERSRVWRSWADRLLASGREAYPAILASKRDAASADRLAGGAL